MYPNQTDRITDIFNNLIRVTEQNNCGELLEELVMTKPMGGPHELVFRIRNEYRNPNIMMDAIFHTTDKLLNWFDLTDFYEFNILIHINDWSQKYIRMSYFELFKQVLVQGSGYDPDTFRPRNGMVCAHPRYEKFMRWVSKKMLEERREYNEKIHRAFNGGEEFYKNADFVFVIPKPKKKGLVGRIKEKILNLWYV